MSDARTVWRGRLAAATGVAASALAFALYAQAVWPWIALGWVGLVPFLAVLDRVDTFGRAALLGVGMAVAFELAVFGWFAFAIADYAGTNVGVPVLVLVAASPLLQPQFVVMALARTAVRRRGADRVVATILVTAASYLAAESLVPKLFGDTLGYPLVGAPWLRQGADLSGVPGLTFVLVLVNACGAAALGAARAGRARADVGRIAGPLAAALTLVAVLAGYGAWRVRTLAPDPAVRPMTVALVQADLGHYDRMAEEIGRYATVRSIIDAHVELSRPVLARRDLGLLVWPETVYPTTFGKPKSDAGADFDREIVDFVARSGVPLMFGSYDTDGTSEFNAAFFLAPDAGAPRPFAVYRKARLFPLTERVPAFLDAPAVRRLLPWLGSWVAGTGTHVVPVALPDGTTIRVAPLICYDVLDPGLARAAARGGADVIITLSNDSWFSIGPAPELHLQGAIFRSIETRRPQVRATNTGISAVVDATGAVVTRTRMDERTTVVASIVPERRIMTLVVRFGEWLNPCALVLTVAILLVMRGSPASSQGSRGRF